MEWQLLPVAAVVIPTLASHLSVDALLRR